MFNKNTFFLIIQCIILLLIILLFHNTSTIAILAELAIFGAKEGDGPEPLTQILFASLGASLATVLLCCNHYAKNKNLINIKETIVDRNL